MLANLLIKTTYPTINNNDNALLGLQLMEDYDISNLVVLNENDFIGIVNKDDLLDVDGSIKIVALQENFKNTCVQEDEHFSSVVKKAVENNIDIVPIINIQKEYLGCVHIKDVLTFLNHFIGNDEPGGIIVMEMDKRNFSFGEISRLVETNDAYLTQLNTNVDVETGLLLATIKINKKEISDIVATFQRYDYNVVYYFGDEQYANELKDNYNHLMAYLNI